MSLRTTTRFTLAWAFGICLSILLVSLWGRAVVTDTATLSESLAPLGQSDVLGDLLADWMSDELDQSGVDPAMAAPTVDLMLGSATVEHTVAELVDEMVLAAASSDPAGASVDVRSLLAPAIPEVTAGLAGMGYPVTENTLHDVVEDLDPLVIRQPGARPLVGPSSPTATRLGTASLVAAIGLISFGSAYVLLSRDRLQALRSLFNRIAVGGASFAVLLWLGSWVADPRGGRAPVQETISNVAGSQWMFPMQVAIGAAFVGSVVYVVRRQVRRGAGSRPPSGSARPRPEPADSRAGRG
ncbi:MAG TPA: hypothetical protein VI141_07220 [Acidimicrobiia bacterium]